MERTAQYSRNTIRERGVYKLSAVLLGGGMALSACGGGEAAPDTGASQTPSTAETQAASPTLVFDNLGGGSSIIQVYPGVTDADRQANGTYNAGDAVSADCKTVGRTVRSDPSVGELNRISDQWIRIQGTPSETQYATVIYVQSPDELLARLPDC